MGWGWGLGPSKEGGTFLRAAEFVSCFTGPLSLALREAQIPPLLGPQFPHLWNTGEPSGAIWDRGERQASPGIGPAASPGAVGTDGGEGGRDMRARV